MEEENKRDIKFVAYDSIFLNSDNVFIEYSDVIKGPWFMFLDAIRKNPKIQNIFDMSAVIDLSLQDLLIWYAQRKEQHIMLNFPVREDFVNEHFAGNKEEFAKWAIKLPYDGFTLNPDLLKPNTWYNFADSIEFICGLEFVKSVYIYTDIESDVIKDDFITKFGEKNKITFVSGDIKDIITNYKISKSTTFVLSDLKKIRPIAESEILPFSSIVIAEPFRYNYNEENNPVVDIQWMYDNIGVFKIAWFNNMPI